MTDWPELTSGLDYCFTLSCAPRALLPNSFAMAQSSSSRSRAQMLAPAWQRWLSLLCCHLSSCLAPQELLLGCSQDNACFSQEILLLSSRTVTASNLGTQRKRQNPQVFHHELFAQAEIQLLNEAPVAPQLQAWCASQSPRQRIRGMLCLNSDPW